MLSHTKRHDRFDNAHSVVKYLSRTFCRGVLCGDFCGLLRGDLQGVDKLVSALLFTYLGDSLQNGNVSNYTQLTLASVAKG